MAGRRGRIQAANEAVDAWMRADGTRDYQAAFLHVQATRPELFADMQDPSGSLAANFNPYHDELGKFTTSGGAVAPHGRQHHARPAQRRAGKKASPRSIAGYAFDSEDFATCVAAAIRSLIATKQQTRNVLSWSLLPKKFL